MSVPHTTSKKAESENDRAENWIYNAKKEWISNKVDWSVNIADLLIVVVFFNDNESDI